MKITNSTRFCFTMIIFLLLTALSAQDKKSDEDVDYVSLAALLIKDGFFDRAESVLANVDPSQEGIDRIRFHTLRGVVFMKKELLVEAKNDFLASLKAGQNDPLVHLYLAQVHFRLHDFPEALKSIEKSGNRGNQFPYIQMIRAHSLWNLGDRKGAINALVAGEKQFRGDHQFLRQKFFYLLEMQLFQEASIAGESYLTKAKAVPLDYIAIGSGLRKSGETGKALIFLESARLLFPHSSDVLIELAHAYIDNEQLETAAQLFEEASVSKPELTIETAELYKQSGNMLKALMLNAEISDQKEKLRQRISILIETGDYEKAVASIPALSRHDLLENEDIRYAIAYAFYMVGEYENAESHLKHLRNPDLFRKAAELRKLMETCNSKGWQCL